MDIKLMPCPFCGKTSAYVDESHTVGVDGGLITDTHWHVTCAYCEVETRSFNSRDDAVHAWNTRVKEVNKTEYIYASSGEPLANSSGQIFLARIGTVVRCKDCKNFTPRGTHQFEDGCVNEDCCSIIHGWKAQIAPNGFCAWGERKN